MNKAAPFVSLLKTAWATAVLGAVLSMAAGCARQAPYLVLDGIHGPAMEGAIWDTHRDQAVTFDQLVDRLQQVKVVYIGERHNDPAHHHVQLKIIRALTLKDHSIQVGMEMFDHTYQHKLDRWTAGDYDWPTFLRQVHWYANWKHDDVLYRDILMFIQAEKLRLVGLNIPFWLPPKIATGGLDSLADNERALLPAHIDTNVPGHRAYLESIFKMHHSLKGRDNFEHFYQAQCAWEEGMAQAITENPADGIMVVLAGNGHIQNKFGIPNRAFARTSAPFITIYLATAGDKVRRQTADFIWAVSPSTTPGHP